MNLKRTALLALTAALTALALAWIAPAVKADEYAYYAEYNRQRAQRLFLTSPSPYRTYSGFTPGYVHSYSTPTQYVREWQTPAYRHERITPRGYERFDGPSERGYSAVSRPVVIVPRYSYPYPDWPSYTPTPRSLRTERYYPPAARPSPRTGDDYYPPVP
jgi:hypothetical protein